MVCQAGYTSYDIIILNLKLWESIWNINETNREVIIATIEVVGKKFVKLCSLNSEIEELAKDAENNQEIYDNCLQIEVNITIKISSLKSLADEEKELIKNSESKPKSFKRKCMNLPKLTIEAFKDDYTKFNTFMGSFVNAIGSCKDIKYIENLTTYILIWKGKHSTQSRVTN